MPMAAHPAKNIRLAGIHKPRCATVPDGEIGEAIAIHVPRIEATAEQVVLVGLIVSLAVDQVDRPTHSG